MGKDIDDTGTSILLSNINIEKEEEDDTTLLIQDSNNNNNITSVVIADELSSADNNTTDKTTITYIEQQQQREQELINLKKPQVRFLRDVHNISGSGSITRTELDDDVLDESEFVTNEHPPLYLNNIYEKVLNYSNKLRGDARIYQRELIITITYLACFISLGISVGSLGPTLLLLAENTNSNLERVGYFLTSRGLGYFLGSVACRFYDRVKNGHFVAGGAVALMSVSLFIVPLIHNIWVAGIVFFFEGIGAGLLDSGLNTMIVWVWKQKVNPFMQLLHFAFGLGALLAPFIISMMIKESLFIQYLVLSIIMFVAGIPIVLVKPVPPYHSDENVEIPETSKRLRIEVIAAVALFLFCYVGGESGFGNWIFTYAKLNLGLEDQHAALLNSLFWTSFTISRLAGVFISLVLSPHQMVVFDMIGCFFFTALLIIFNQSHTILWLATAGLGISLASIFPTCFSLPQNLGMPVTGESTSYMVIGATAGEITIPWAIGVAQHNIGMHVLPWAIMIFLFIALVIYVAIVARARYVQSKEKGQTLEFKSLVNIIDINSLNLKTKQDNEQI